MVKIGSARIDENGNISGGKAGDQTGKEVSTQDWYLHSKGWVVIRPKKSAVAKMIANNMQAACDNDLIGYCQAHRTSAETASKPYNYDLSKVKVACEVDCSKLVQLCCRYAGVNVGNFNTASEVSALSATGEFDILRDDKYCKSSDYLKRGDILVTKTKGHTVVVLNDGSLSGTNESAGTVKKTVAAQHKDVGLAGTYVTTTDLNLRYKQGQITPDNVACVIPAGAAVQCYGYYNIVSGVKWYLVAYNGKTGYASSKCLKKK